MINFGFCWVVGEPERGTGWAPPCVVTARRRRPDDQHTGREPQEIDAICGAGRRPDPRPQVSGRPRDHFFGMRLPAGLWLRGRLGVGLVAAPGGLELVV